MNALLAVALLLAGCRSACAVAGVADEDVTVHLVMSAHLDVGFTDVDDNVINTYFYEHFPRAIRLGRELEAQGQAYNYMTHSFLVSLYLDCPPDMGWTCPDAAAVQEFESAVRRGVITWHAIPYNPHYELFEPSLLRFAVALTHDLDARFNLRPKSVVSLRDVPGFSRAAIPVLAAAGVRAISGGVNGFSAPPGVPKNRPFIWKDTASGTQLLAMWHPGGYGGCCQPGQCVEAPGFSHVLCCHWSNWDNHGPPDNASEVLAARAQVAAGYPGARLLASTFDAYVDELAAASPALDLPVVTGEDGDTWQHGTGSDVVKLADYLVLARLRAGCLADAACDSQSPAFYNFSRLLLKVPEHTWGIAFLQYFGDATNYTNAYLHPRLAKAQQDPGYSVCLRSWVHQYAWIEAALQALPASHPVRAGFDRELDQQRRAEETEGADMLARGATRLAPGSPADFTTRHWRIGVDWRTGGLSRLQRLYSPDAAPALHLGGSAARGWGHASDSAGQLAPASLRRRRRRGRSLRSVPGIDWADGGGRDVQLGAIQYNVYNLSAYDIIWDTYAYMYPVWNGDFGKENLTASSTLQGQAMARLLGVYHTRGEAGTQLHLEYDFPDWMVRDAGAPAKMWAVLEAPDGDEALHLTVVWQAKTPTRLPEALWLRLRPSAWAVNPASWMVNKLGSWISPSEIMLNGSHSIVGVQPEHALRVDSREGDEQLLVSSYATPLAAMGVPNAFPNARRPPDMAQGMSFNLVNNVWGTNWPQWIPYWARDVNRAFRFKLEVRILEEGAARAVVEAEAQA